MQLPSWTAPAAIAVRRLPYRVVQTVVIVRGVRITLHQNTNLDKNSEVVSQPDFYIGTWHDSHSSCDVELTTPFAYSTLALEGAEISQAQHRTCCGEQSAEDIHYLGLHQAKHDNSYQMRGRLSELMHGSAHRLVLLPSSVPTRPPFGLVRGKATICTRCCVMGSLPSRTCRSLHSFPVVQMLVSFHMVLRSERSVTACLASRIR
jgi:hypothetical protein